MKERLDCHEGKVCNTGIYSQMSPTQERSGMHLRVGDLPHEQIVHADTELRVRVVS